MPDGQLDVERPVAVVYPLRTEFLYCFPGFLAPRFPQHHLVCLLGPRSEAWLC